MQMAKTRDGLFNCTLRKRRIMFGYGSTRDFARALGVCDSQVHRWETGQMYPSMPNIIKIEKLLQCRMADIYEPLN